MQNIDILTHFTEVQRADKITVYTLKPMERAQFLSKLPTAFREMYISDDKLARRLQNVVGTTRVQEISEKLPTKGHLRSGEFSELLSYFLIPERYLPDSHLRPPKLRWKESRDIPAHFTDVIFFRQADFASPDAGDCLVSVETKSAATRPAANSSSLQLAMNDVEKDFTSRLGESLFYLKTKYKDEEDYAALTHLQRFTEASYPPYRKHFKAVAIVDDAFGDRHIQSIVSWPLYIKDSFEVILVRIDNMQDGYNTTFQQMLAT